MLSTSGGLPIKSVATSQKKTMPTTASPSPAFTQSVYLTTTTIIMRIANHSQRTRKNSSNRWRHLGMTLRLLHVLPEHRDASPSSTAPQLHRSHDRNYQFWLLAMACTLILHLNILSCSLRHTYSKTIINPKWTWTKDKGNNIYHGLLQMRSTRKAIEEFSTLSAARRRPFCVRRSRVVRPNGLQELNRTCNNTTDRHSNTCWKYLKKSKSQQPLFRKGRNMWIHMI